MEKVRIKDCPKQYGWLVDKSLGDLTKGCHKKVLWKCDKCGYEWESSVSNVLGLNSGCPCCSGHVIVKSINDLWTVRPDMAAKLANPEDGYKLGARSTKKVDWKCDKCGQIWRTSVGEFIDGRGCPVCANKKIVKGINDLWTTHPEMASKLLNSEDGYKVSYGSNKKVKWKCDVCGGVWEKSVKAMFKSSVCPICTNKKIVKGVNDIWTTHPDVAVKLVNVEDGYSVSFGSHKILRWKCDDCGYEWDAEVIDVIRNKKCPVCSNRVTVRGRNDLWTTHPDIAEKLADPEDGYKVNVKCGKCLEWKCDKCGYVRKSTIDRVLKGHGCSVCANKKIVKGVNDLWTLNPKLASELLNAEDGYKVTCGTDKKVKWKCNKCGEVWEASVVNRSKGKGCPVCANLKIVRGVNDLWTVRPDVAEKLANPEDGYKLSYGANKKARWKCDKCGCEWDAVVRTISNGIGCPVCSNRKVVRGVNDLWTTHPDIAVQLFDRSQGYELSAGSNKKVKWLCPDCGCIIEAVVAWRTGGKGCPVCANKKIVKGVNDLWTLMPDVAARLWDPEDGYKITCNTNKKVKWRCVDCGREWKASVSDVVRKDRKTCPVCSNRKIIVGVNDLWTTNPDEAAMLADANDGYKVSAGSEKKLLWRCDECGYEWQATVYNIAGNKSGCPKCFCGKHASKQELDLCDYIVSLGVDVEEHNRVVLGGRELDIYVPSKKIAFEYNGLYWHSDDRLNDTQYHRRKFLDCEKQGIQLVTIWEDDWKYHQNAVKDMVKYKLGVNDGKRVYARKCDIRLVDVSEAYPFLDENHIQGHVNATYHFGLYFENELVALLSCRSPRHNARMKRKDGQWEIQRYATKGSVVGGFSKLMKYAEGYIDGITSWISFSSNDVSNGNMYLKCGFELDKELSGDYKYFGAYTGFVRKPKESFQKRCFEKKEGLLFEEGLTERELAQLNELHRVYDCGKRRWTKDVMV